MIDTITLSIDYISRILANVGIIFAVFIINIYIGIYLVVSITLLYFLENKRMQKYYQRKKMLKKLEEKNTGLISELVRGIRDIKVLNAESRFMSITKEKINQSTEEWYKMSKVNRQYNLLIASAQDLFDLGFIVLGVTLKGIGIVSVTSLVIIYNYLPRIIESLWMISSLLEQINIFNLAANRVFVLTEERTFKQEKFGLINLPKVHGNFEFNRVSFSYQEGIPILKDMSFKIHENETVAFVGKSGAGKTTIFNLLNRLYDIDDGKITIDGIDITTLNKESLRNNISIITQSPYIFNMSIKDNLTLVKPDLNNEEMIEICKMACLHDFVMSLPNGYDTIVGEGGYTLSGGQRQRLAIARALVKKTEIILFDEATSALDNETQKNIQKAIDNMKGEYTMLIIAHRLSTIINCDRILFLDDGKIVAEGTHNYLLKNNEQYRTLYEMELEKNI